MAEEQITLAKKIRARYTMLEEIRRPAFNDMKDISKYVYPRRELMDLDEDPGTTVGKYMYDSAPNLALKMLANGFQGHMISPSIKWFDLNFMDRRLREYPVAQRWLDDIREALYETFERSNCYARMHEFIMDGCSLATATQHMEEDLVRGIPVYRTHHPAEIVIAENDLGQVDTVFRRFKLSSRAAVKKFGAGKLPRCIKEAAEKSASADVTYEFLHMVCPVSDDWLGGKTFYKKPWGSVYLTYEAYGEEADDQGGIIRMNGYKRFPYWVWRFMTNSGEWYGRGPAHDAMPDIMTLHQVKKDLLEASHLSVRPPMYVPAEHRHRLRLTPGGRNYYSKYAEERIEPIMTNINYPVGIDMLRDIRQQIREHFMVDFFLMLQQEQGQRTATEVLELQGEKAAVLGSTVGMYETECLDPMINETFYLEYEAGRLPEIPEELIEAGGTNIRISYIGPLAQLQRRAFKAHGVIHSLEALTALLNLYPEVRHKIKAEEAAEVIMDDFDMPHRVIRSDHEYEQLVMAEQQAMAQQQQAALGKEIADAVPKLGKKIEKGSVLDQLQGKQLEGAPVG